MFWKWRKNYLLDEIAWIVPADDCLHCSCKAEVIFESESARVTTTLLLILAFPNPASLLKLKTATCRDFVRSSNYYRRLPASEPESCQLASLFQILGSRPAFCCWIYSNAVNFVESVINIGVVFVFVFINNCCDICHRNEENCQEKHCWCRWF